MRIARVLVILLASAAVPVLGTRGPVTVQPGGRPSIDSVLDTLDRVQAIRETAVSPDGTGVAFVYDLPAAEGGGSAIGETVHTPRSTLQASVSGGAGGQHERGSRDRSPAWSPDGKSLAFLSDAGGQHQTQLYVAPVLPQGIAGAPRRLTSVTGQLAHPIWSPDGTRIALLYVAGSTQATGALVAYKPDAGVVGETVEEQRIAIVEVATGGIREISPANLFVYDYDWSPDGTSFAAEAVEGSGTDNYWTAQLFVISVTGAAQVIWRPPFQIAWPRWSPDGRSIAVIHGLMSDEGSNGGDVYLVPPDGGPARIVPATANGSARSLHWRHDGTLLVDEYVDGTSQLVTVGASGDLVARFGELAPRQGFIPLPKQYTAVSVARRADAVSLVIQSFVEPPAVYAGALGQWTRQTGAPTGVTPLWSMARSLHWKSSAPGGVVQGWLLCPSPLDESRKYPLVVSVHGGPSSAHVPAWPARWNAVLPSQGYCVLMPNPRGSYGSGEAFTQANIKDFGYGDLQDILGGVDAAIADGHVDANRIGITGWSYGGYMTMWAVTQTTRFKAAVAGAGIASWQSYYGQNKIDQWLIPFFGASVYDDPDVYARSSPITFIKKVKTPTLVLHGDRDSEVPTPQGYEFWHALKAIGVPTELVIYPNEGHGIAQPEHQHDIERRLVAWFDKYLR